MYPQYEDDFYGWISANVMLLKQKRFGEMDIDNLIEELEGMGRSEKRSLVSRLAQLIFHLLKWQYQPDFRSRSWQASIKEQREMVKELLLENPSLKSMLGVSLVNAYKHAILLIQKETPIDLKLLPQDCPYSFEQLMDDTFYAE